MKKITLIASLALIFAATQSLYAEKSILKCSSETKTTFPSKIINDSFDGIPVEIIFDQNYTESISKFIKKSTNGSGTPASPLKTFAKIYYETKDKKTISTFECKRIINELKKFPPNENSYQKSLGISTGAWRFNNLNYKDFTTLNHSNSELRAIKPSTFLSQNNYDNEKKKSLNATLPKGTISILISFRIDTEENKYIIVIKKATFENDYYYSGSVFIHENNEWKFLSNNSEVESVMPVSFAHALTPLFENKPTDAKISPL